jgi:large subunit ribosomal protein L10
LPSIPALIFTNLEPFKFYSIVDKLKSLAFAKEGDIAEEDIEVKAGPTTLLPGPVIGELSRAGIPVGVEEGKIAIKKDIIVARKGEKISKMLADALKKLKIQPIKVGLNVVAAYQNGKIYLKDTLELIKIYPEKLKEALNQALNLSINVCYPTKENIKFLLTKAFNTAKSLEKIGVKT